MYFVLILIGLNLP